MKPHYKPIASESSLFKVEYQETTKQFYYPWHYHAELELTFILSGRGVRYVGNSTENFLGEELVLLGSNLPHMWNNAADLEEPITAIVIYLKEAFLESAWINSFEFAAVKNLLTAMGKGIMVDPEKASQLRPKFFSLINAPDLDKVIILLQILQTLAQQTKFRFLCEQEFVYDQDDIEKKRINTIYEFIQSNYLKQITLADLASKMNMTEEYFSRFFSKAMKKPFFEFLNEYKINRACKLLIETDKQVSEICYASGFESLPFFYRQFKKFKSCQPKTYRCNYQNISALNLPDEEHFLMEQS